MIGISKRLPVPDDSDFIRHWPHSNAIRDKNAFAELVSDGYVRSVAVNGLVADNLGVAYAVDAVWAYIHSKLSSDIGWCLDAYNKYESVNLTQAAFIDQLETSYRRDLVHFAQAPNKPGP